MNDLFPRFTARDLAAGPVRIRGRAVKSGPPVLLLHGYTRTHAMWHRVAGTPAERFTVVAADLRGYGDSAKPRSALDRASCSRPDDRGEPWLSGAAA